MSSVRTILSMASVCIVLAGCETSSSSSLSTDQANVLLDRAKSLESQGLLAEARLFYRALGDSADDPVALKAQDRIRDLDVQMADGCERYTRRGQAALGNKKFREARTSFLRALAIDPHCSAAIPGIREAEAKLALIEAERRAARN